MPADLLYIDNDVVDVVGAEHMELQALREPYKSIRVVATCCYSILGVDHDAYCGHGTPLPAGAAATRNVVMLITGACKLTGTSRPPFPPSKVIYKADWEVGVDGAMPTIEQYRQHPTPSAAAAAVAEVPLASPAPQPGLASAATESCDSSVAMGAAATPATHASAAVPASPSPFSAPVHMPLGVPLKESAAWKGKAVRVLGLTEGTRFSDR